MISSELKMKLLLVLLPIIFHTGICVKHNYNGYKIHRINIKNENDFHLLSSIKNSEKHVEFLTEPNLSNIPVDILVPPEDCEEFFDFLFKYNIGTEILIEDVQRYVILSLFLI